MINTRKNSMLKKSITIMALLAAGAAYADNNDWRIKGQSGNVATVMPTTVRTYTNALGLVQHDALVELKSATLDERFRFGVTGCSDSHGLIAIVDATGESVGSSTQKSWAIEGSRMYDGIAIKICEAAARRPGSRSDKKGATL